MYHAPIINIHIHVHIASHFYIKYPISVASTYPGLIVTERLREHEEK